MVRFLKRFAPFLCFLSVVTVILMIGAGVFYYVPHWRKRADNVESSMVTSLSGDGEKRDNNAVEFVSTQIQLKKASSLHLPIAFRLMDSQLEQTRLLGTSWQDPFVESMWVLNSWTVGDEGVRFVSSGERSLNQPSAESFFIRPYQKMMCAFDLKLNDFEGKRRLPRGVWFGVRLASPSTGCVIEVRFENARLRVVRLSKISSAAVSSTLIHRELFSCPLSEALEKQFLEGRLVQIQIAATGNRLSMRCGMRRLFSIDQPAGQSGEWTYFSFIGFHQSVVVPHLRVEGE